MDFTNLNHVNLDLRILHENYGKSYYLKSNMFCRNITKIILKYLKSLNITALLSSK